MDFQVGESSAADWPGHRALEATAAPCPAAEVQPGAPIHSLPLRHRRGTENNHHHLIGALTTLETVPMVTHMSLQ